MPRGAWEAGPHPHQQVSSQTDGCGAGGAGAQSPPLRLRAGLNLWHQLLTGWVLSSSLLSCPLPPSSLVLEACPSLIAGPGIPAPRLCFRAAIIEAHT